MPEYHLPMHPAQQDVYMDQLLNTDSPQYNIGGYIVLKGKLEKKKFQEAVASAPVVFDAFKMRFDLDAQDLLCHYDWDYTTAILAELDFSSHTDAGAAAREWMQERFNTAFELKKESLPFEQFLIKITEEEYWFYGKYHHLITDGYGFIVYVQYVSEKYRALVSGEEVTFSHPQYAEASTKATEYYHSADYQADGEYWREKIPVKPEKLLQKRYGEIQGKTGATWILNLEEEKRAELEALQQASKSGLQQLTIAALLIYFGKTTTANEFIFGTPIHKRGSRQLRNTVGMFSGILPFKGNYNKEQTVADLLKEVAGTQRSDYRHQNYLIGDLSRDLKINRAEDSLTEVQVNYEPLGFELNFGEEIGAHIVRLANEDEQNPLQLVWRDYGKQEALQLQIQFRYNYFSQEEIAQLAQRVLFIIDQFAGKLDGPVASINILTDQEQTQLKAFNNTAAAYPKDKSIVALFQEQVIKTPNSTAVICEEEQLTYNELNKSSNQLAHYLQKQGIKAETLVPICIERSTEMLIGILGILKAGGAYVPIDPEYPADRISYMLEDTGAELVLSSSGSRGKLKENTAKVISLDEDWQHIAKEKSNTPDTAIHPEQLAYVIYTSGSTGRPKGVMIEHRNVYAFIAWCGKEFSSDRFDVAYATTSICFDLSVFELFYPLSTGKTIRILENGLAIGSYLTRDSQVLINTVPSVVAHLLNEKTDLTKVSLINMAGEPIPLRVSEGLDTETIKVRNLYGPTEDTTYSTNYVLEKGKPVNIGKPIANTQIHILNGEREQVPVGVAGEICIGGAGVARGYLNKKELTAEKFIADPFSKEQQARLYKTGDLGRWLSDGNIEYLGRIDDQVKIRGFRIELGEIESVLNGSGQVMQAVVLAKEDKQGTKRLVGYVVKKDTFDKQAIQSYLNTKLPEYMVPAIWVELENIPLTPNGKTDKKALPDPEITDRTTAYTAPRNETEQALAEIWQELLSIERVGIYDNFFDLGGHSLTAMRVVSAIRRELQAEIGIKNIFVHPTIISLGVWLSEQGKGILQPALTATHPRPEHIALSFSQERLWFIDRLEGSVQYHIPAVLRINGTVNYKLLEKTFRTIIDRHEVLRTVVQEDKAGWGYQEILPSSGWSLTFDDYTKEDTAALETQIEELVKIPFNLSGDYMLRANLVKTGKETHVLIVTMHHIASDGWSASILVKEVIEIYAAFTENREATLPLLQVQYADYAIWQRNWLQGAILEEKLQYWKEKLNDVSPLELPTDYVRPSVPGISGASLGFNIGKELSAQLQSLSNGQGATLYMTLLSAFNALLYRYSGQEDICVGTPVAGRQQYEVEGLIGFFVNTLVLRNRVSGGMTFTELLEEIKETTLEAYSHQEVPFEKVVDAVVKVRDMSRSPLFQVMFVFQNTPEIPEMRLGNAALTLEEKGDDVSKYDLTFTLAENANGISGTIQYNTELYNTETIKMMVAHYRQLLNSILFNPSTRVGQLAMLSASEETQLLEAFNDTAAVYPREKNIVSLIEEQVAKSPETTAVACEGKELSYKELNERSNQLANYLQKKGVKAETLVPICMERSLEMIVGIVGILKAGGVYIPIDPEYPQDRISYMLEDTAATLVLSGKESREKLQDSKAEIISLDEDWQEIAKEKSGNLNTAIRPDQLAYIIFTSGSTGRPKGVLIEHYNVVRLFKTEPNLYDFNADDVWTMFHSFCFDFSVWEMYGALFYGGKVVIVPKDVARDTLLFAELLQKEKVTILNQTPSAFYNLQEVYSERGIKSTSIRYVIFGGEALNPGKLEYWKQRYENSRLINMYGITETTVHVTYREIEWEHIRGGQSIIGKPIPTLKAYILDKDGQLTPAGVPGELHIGGAGLARGYLNRAELTAERFIKDPYSKEKGARLYKTGDLGRWLADGNIEYLGRIDDQVKIRGFRIELGEIENALNQSEQVSQGVVLAKGDSNGNKRLIGYIVPTGTFDKQAIQEYLSTKLPEYMVPALWVELESIPLTSNGKVNRKALPDVEFGDMTAGYVAPRNEIETKLAQIWQELLEIEQAGIYDNFFELGGHSLLAMRVVSAIRRELNVEINIRNLFTYPVIAGLSGYLEKQDKGTGLPAIKAEKRPEQIPLSFSQERLWFIDRLEGSVQYHIPAVLRLNGKVNSELLEKTLRAIIDRHEILRTVIQEDAAGKGYQQILPVSDWSLTIEDYTKKDAIALEWHIEELVKTPFNLSADYMLRASLVKAGKEANVLVVTMHHIASDGWSTSILVKEIVEIYEAYARGREAKLPILPVQFADYAIWQRRHLQGELLEGKLNYWKEKLEGTAQLELPMDYIRPAIQSARGARYQLNIDKKLSDQLIGLSNERGVTLYMTLLAAFKVLLSRYSGQEDICVGTPIAGRSHHEIEGLIGFFVNTLALRSHVNSESAFTGLLEEIKTTTLEAYNYQDVPFEKVVDAVVKERDMSRSPLFQVVFVLQNTPDIQELKLGDTTLKLEEGEHETSKFDLTLTLTETTSGLSASIDYCTDLYEDETVVRMAGHYINLLNSIVAKPDEKISSLGMLSASEETQLLEDFNDTAAVYPREKNIVSLIEEQVAKSPETTAVAFEGKELTYKELNERSNQLANYLQKKGVKAETLVPICIERSLEMIIGIVGILKAGGVYVPIDPEYPQDRISYMLEDTAATLVLSSKESREKLQDSKTEIISLDEDWKEIAKEKSSNLDTAIRPDQLAYIIFTSGSTGRPKGVLIEHYNVVRLFKTEPNLYDFNADDVWTMFHSFCFDFSVWEMYGALFYGGKVVIVPKDVARDTLLFAELLQKEKVTILNQTPSAFYNLQEVYSERNIQSTSIRYVIFGGEALNPGKLEYWKQKYENSRLINMYGITETTVHVTYREIEWEHIRGGQSIIGKPIPTLKAYILDKDGQLTPAGVPGELHIGGAGLARGYLNRPELTAERFIKDPYSKEKGARLYRTGDLGRWQADGNIEYLGRIDDQVKIRGFRIELGEIENALNQSEQVSQGVVLAKGDSSGNKRLIGYVVPTGTFDKQAIQEYLATKLPEYMVPALWVELQGIPLTSNGKVNKKALPEPELGDMASGYVAPRDETEQLLADIWQELLGVERVGIYDNFFELGGDSILTIQVVSRMRRFGHVIQPKDIFNNQIIANLSGIIRKQSAHSTDEQGSLSGSFPLLPIQEWYLEKADKDISHYNQSVLLAIDKKITGEVLQTVVEQLMIQHDALRLSFEKKEGTWKQTYGNEKGQLLQEDLRKISSDNLESQIKTIADRHQRSLSIEQGKLVRVVWIQTPESEQSNRLLFIIHHLAVDGVSWRILLGDVDRILDSLMKGEQVALGAKSSSYRQWYKAMSEYGQSTALSLQKGYWEQTINNNTELPEDKTYTGSVRMKDMSVYQVKLGAAQTRQLLQDVPRVYHTEINDLLLSALSATLCNWSENDQVVIGLEGHGREAISAEIDSSNTVGWFTSLYPVLLKNNRDIDSLIKGVKEDLRRIPDKGLGFGVLKYIEKMPALQGKDQWDLVFNYLGQLDAAIVSGKWLGAANEDSGMQLGDEQLSPSKLSVNAQIFGGELILRWGYSDKHYEQETISKLAEEYVGRLSRLIAHCIEQGKSAEIYTPSDFGLGAEIGYEELDRFMEEPFMGKERKRSIESIYRLTGLQQGMLFHGLYDKDSEGYIQQVSCDLFDLNRDALLVSWSVILKRHSILRSAFYYDSFSVPVQCVYHQASLPIDELDYRGMDAETQQSAIKEYEAADRATSFDFKFPPLMRLGLIRLTDTRYRMVWTSHHLLYDGWSLPIIMEEFLTTYELFASGQPIPEGLEDCYEDYIRYLEQKDKNAEESYWRNYFKGVEQGTLLPFVTTTTDRTKGKGKYEFMPVVLDDAKAAQVQTFVQANRLTVNTLMQGVLGWLLHKYTGDPEVIFGAVVSGRPDDMPAMEHSVGMYINTLPIKVSFDENKNTVEWLQRLQGEQVASREFQYTPLQDIQQWAGIKNDLFDCLLTFENYPVSKMLTTKKWLLEAENLQVRAQSNYPLTIIVGTADELSLSFNYNTELLSEEAVFAIRNQFVQALLQISSGSVETLNDIRLLTPSQEHQVLVAFNDSHVSYPSEKTLVDLIEEQAQKNPDGIAVVFEEVQLSYRALNERSNQLGHYLRSKGVKEETLVPLLIERGADMLIGMLGILKAGACYVPIDLDFPQERISYMLEDTAAKVVVSNSTASEKLPSYSAISLDVIELDEERMTLRQQPSVKPETSLKPDNLAYVIYTSGSTGKPKGVQVSHENLVDYTYGLDNKINISSCKSFALVSSIATDLGNTVLYGALLTGGTLHVFTKETVSHIEALHEYFERHQVDCLKIVPSHWKALTMEDQPLLPAKLLIFGGEALTPEAVELIKNTGSSCRIVNHYGPTETTIGKLLHEVDTKKTYTQTIPVGKPFSNTKAYILNKELGLCPIGVPGQLYIAGKGIARGYLNNDELTREKFIQNPWGEKGERMYGTGDRVQYQADGNITFIGRVDDQVKIRGYRVEPGEVGRILEQSEWVAQAIVLAKDDKQGNKQLVGYIVPNNDYDKQQLQEYLREQLPDYMIPAHLVTLERFPMTQNGKIDRKALPDPEGTETQGGYVAPRNETEAKLAELWQDILEVEEVGINDDFFEIGGHSLLAVRLVSATRKAFGVELPIAEVFDYPTVGQLAARLTATADEEQPATELMPEIKAEVRPEYIPLSFSQERLWFIDRLEGSVQYHIPAVLRLKGKLNQAALANAFKTIVSRHEVLRTVILEDAEGNGYQQIMPVADWSLILDDKTGSKDAKALRQHIEELIKASFDLSQDYKLRANLIKINEDEHILVATLHHIASDGWSRSILVSELVELYASSEAKRPANLPVLPVQYADYAIWQRKYLQGEVLESKLGYWKEKLSGVLPLELPTDFTRPSTLGIRGSKIDIAIDKKLTSHLHALSQGHGTTLYMTLLSAFKVLLYNYSRQEDICVGTPIAGRNQQEIEGLIGFFINTLALRTKLTANETFGELLARVKNTTLDAYANQEVPFEKVVDAVVKNRDTSRSPLFQVLFSLQNTPEIPELKLGELSLSSENPEHTTAKFDIAFLLVDTSSGIRGVIEYSTDLYKSETIVRMMGHFINLLNAIVLSPNEQVGRLEILSSAEQALLTEFNNTASSYPKDKGIAALFEEQVTKNPKATAIIYGNQELSYQELNERSNQLAHYLQKQGVKSETLVPICVERSIEMMVGILGILKAGGAYVPIDPDYPQDRISYMLEDTGATIILSNSGSKEKLTGSKATVISLDNNWQQINTYPTSNLSIQTRPDNLGYVIYTSGSTGRPKGAMIEQRSVVSLVKGVDYVTLGSDDTLLVTGSPSFDATTFEYWGMLLNGGKLVLCSLDELLDSEKLKATIDQHKVTIMWFTSSWFNQLADSRPEVFSGLRTILAGGEKLSENHIEKIRKTYPDLKLINGYGPTENTTFSLTYAIDKVENPIPIGRPLNNRTAYVLNSNREQVPIGVAGEVCLGGTGVARGYLNNPELTEEKFIKDPFSNESDARLYRTGDLGRWLPDGNIQYLGRMDDQVKIRGYRIELGEIENVLNQSDLVNQSVVLVKTDKQAAKRLVGYVVPNETFDKQAIQNYLKTKLPDYMVPAVWVELESMPLTSNGKVDKRALPDPELADMAAEYVAPRNATEQALANIWQELLNVERVGIYDNFFELGGHSLLAMRVVSYIKRDLKVSIPINMLFQFTSISDLSQYLEIQTNSDLQETNDDEFDVVVI